jgi:hexulose-6-phosphate isomerase
MPSPITRRRFVQASGLLLGAAALPSLACGQAPATAQAPGQRIRKAVGWTMLPKDLSLEDKLRLAKEVGFEGIEMSSRYAEPKALAAASEKLGIPIHGVTSGGYPDIQAAIDDAAIYGADSVLHVVRADANAPFMEHYRRTQEAIRAAIPLAEKKRISILIENVWATFLIEPLSMARYIDELASPYVKAYFDVGNVMRWGWPQQWIEVLGHRIGKIHIKEYSLKVAMKEGMIKAFDFPIGEGDIDWKRVREELAKINFRSWATAEVRGGTRQQLADVSAQMTRVLGL